MPTSDPDSSPDMVPAVPVGTAGAASVDRALRILFAVASGGPSVTLAALAARTGLYKSTVLRLVASLQAAALVDRLPDGRFRLGPASAELGARYQRAMAPVDLLLPQMRALADATGESVAYYVPAGLQRICLYRVESRHALRYSVQEGDTLPLDSGSGGRVIAAFTGAAGDVHDRVRLLGYHHSDGERDPQIAGISAPVFHAGQRLAGALTVAGPRARFTPDRAQDALGHLLRAAAAASGAFIASSAAG